MRPFVRQALAGRVVFGEGSLSSLGPELAALGARRPVLVSGVGEELTARVAAHLPGLAATWTDVRQHVPVELAQLCHRDVSSHAADVVVCLGGGSAIGLAKAVALLGGPPIVAVPTTYSGSEMTPIWGQSEAGVKRTGRDLRVLPSVVLYDPELLVSLPAEVVGASGMNALAHCIESLYAPAADPLNSLAALEGARLLVEHLPAAYASTDVGARGEVLWASCLAGHVLGTAGASLHHSVCHLLGGRHDLSHAQTHAVVLPHVLARLVPRMRTQLEPLAGVLGMPVEQLPGGIWDIAAAVGTGPGLAGLGMPASDLAATAEALVDRTSQSDVAIDLATALSLLEDAFRGERPAVPSARPELAVG